MVGASWRGRLVEWDPELDLYVPAGDADFLDGEAEELLALFEAEVVDDGEDVVGEVGDAGVEVVVAGQVVALGGEGVVALLEVVAAAVDVGGAAL